MQMIKWFIQMHRFKYLAQRKRKPDLCKKRMTLNFGNTIYLSEGKKHGCIAHNIPAELWWECREIEWKRRWPWPSWFPDRINLIVTLSLWNKISKSLSSFFIFFKNKVSILKMIEVQRESRLLLLRYLLMITGKYMFWYILGTYLPFLIFFRH